VSRIGVDLDGVCYPFSHIFRLFCEQHLCRLLALPEVWSFHTEQWGLTTGKFLELMRAGCVDAEWVFHLGDPLAGCVEALEQLTGAGHEIVIVTSRPDYARPATEAWLKRWGITHHELHLAVDKTAFELDVLLDDCPAILVAAKAAGIRAVVYDQPWNRTFDKRAPELKGFERVCGTQPKYTAWDRFVTLIEEAAA
jgi:5' nucleotidase, deoxy (Pyrimidine), cytosolic type C protein (NT5C)